MAVAQSALNVAKEALRRAQAAVDKSRGILNAATALLETVKETAKAGLDAVSEIARLGLGGLISIHEIEFCSSIETTATGSFSATMKATLLGSHRTFSFSINLKNVDEMARQLAEKAFPGVIAGRKRRSVVEGTPRQIKQLSAHRPHRRNDFGTEHDTADVEQALELEGRRRFAEQKRLKRDARSLKAAIKETDCVPQQHIHLNIDDLHLDNLYVNPGEKIWLTCVPSSCC